MISPQPGVQQLISSQWFLEIWEKIPELVSLLQEIPLVEKIFFTVNTCSTLKAKMLLLVSALPTRFQSLIRKLQNFIKNLILTVESLKNIIRICSILNSQFNKVNYGCSNAVLAKEQVSQLSKWPDRKSTRLN